MSFECYWMIILLEDKNVSFYVFCDVFILYKLVSNRKMSSFRFRKCTLRVAEFCRGHFVGEFEGHDSDTNCTCSDQAGSDFCSGVSEDGILLQVSEIQRYIVILIK